MKDLNSQHRKPLFENFVSQLLIIDFIRFVIANLRYFYLVTIMRRLKIYNQHGTGVSENTISHNLKGMKDLAVVRSLALIRPLSVIETMTADSKILTIGPRTEGEILNLIAYGFRLKHIQALDLISYSPWIKLGDMHHTSYAENTFDAVILGWVIAYSDTKEQAAKEVIRISKNGGLVAIGVEYSAMPTEDVLKNVGYIPGSTERIFSIQQILNLFNGYVDKIYFQHDIIEAKKSEKGSLIVIFSIKK